MSGKAVWNENLGSALMTGEFVRFNREEGKNHCGQIVDIMQFGSLPAAEKRKYGSDDERCRTANFIKVRWAAIVGDTDGIVRDTDTLARFPGTAGVPELVLRAVETIMPSDNVIAVLLVVFPGDIESGRFPVFGMKDAFMLATEQSAANQLIKLDDWEILPEVRPSRRARARMRATRPSAHAGCAREKSTNGL